MLETHIIVSTLPEQAQPNNRKETLFLINHFKEMDGVSSKEIVLQRMVLYICFYICIIKTSKIAELYGTINRV